MKERQLHTHFKKKDVELIIEAMNHYALENLDTVDLHKRITALSAYLDEELERWCYDCDNALESHQDNYCY